jgi:hypothetical protein
MTGIFAKFAPIYREMGLEPRPVPLGKKAPNLKGWQKPDALIDPDQAASWLTKYADFGIGLRTGSLLPDGTRLGVLDIDRDDLVRVARVIMGPTCERIGSKGTALFFQYPGQLKRKSVRRRLAGGEEQAVADLLVDGAFCMIPPSIHPTTGGPYRWIGAPLENYELCALPLLGLRADLEIGAVTGLRSLEMVLAVLQSADAASLADGVATHDAALGFVNTLLPHTQDADAIVEMVAALLPEGYQGNTLSEVPELVRSGIEKGLHQPGGYSRGNYDPGEEGPIPFGYLANGDFVLFDQSKRIVVPISSNGLVTPGTLLSFAPLAFWAKRFPKEGAGLNSFAAGDAIMIACRERGGFDPGDVRGRGVFPDPRGGHVVNWGDEIPSDTGNIYVCYRSLEVSTTDKEVDPHAVLRLFQRFNWADPSSAILLLGWAASSIICGALRWRPHVFVTGAKNTGKTTLIRSLHRLLDPVAIVLDGQSSEAGIRQKVGADSRPVILDEFESDQNTSRMRQVIKLMRSASSSESTVARGTPEGKALEFVIRSSFLLAAINPMGVTAADRSRIVVLTLGKHQSDRDMANQIAKELEALQGVGPSWCRLLLGRVDQILANIATLERVFPPCDSRHMLNMATLLGAAQAVLLDHPLSEEEAKKLLEEHVRLIDYLGEAHEEDDSINCWNALLEFTVRTDGSSEMLGAMLSHLKTAHSKGSFHPGVEQALARYGIKWDAGGIVIANSHRGLEMVFEGTAWEAGTWGSSFKRLDGAQPTKQRRFGAKRSEGTWIPKSWIPDQDLTSPDY